MRLRAFQDTYSKYLISESTKTGVAFWYRIGFTDAEKVKEEQMTSSPSSTPSKIKAKWMAAVPDESAEQKSISKYLHNDFSKDFKESFEYTKSSFTDNSEKKYFNFTW